MPADHFKTIYADHASMYEEFICHHDVEGNLLPAIEQIVKLDGLDVVEFGAGTGRVTALLAPKVKSIRAFDEAAGMIEVAKGRLSDVRNVSLGVAPNTKLPVPDHSADLTIEGWSFAHTRGWYSETWQDEIGRMLAEMRRITRRGGTVILIETQGTGFETPRAPTPELAEVYSLYENEYGFRFKWIRMDYTFESVDEAARLTGFFFGQALADKIRANGWSRVPECAGIWWKTM